MVANVDEEKTFDKTIAQGDKAAVKNLPVVKDWIDEGLSKGTYGPAYSKRLAETQQKRITKSRSQKSTPKR